MTQLSLFPAQAFYVVPLTPEVVLTEPEAKIKAAQYLENVCLSDKVMYFLDMKEVHEIRKIIEILRT